MTMLQQDTVTLLADAPASDLLASARIVGEQIASGAEEIDCDR